MWAHDDRVFRTLLFAALVFVMPRALAAQELGTLHIKVVLGDADQQPAPVSRHELLISENPSSAVPRLITTGLDGTADVKLRPGNYTVESDHLVVFRGTAYQWTAMVDIVAGRDTVLELTADKADIDAVANSTASSANDPSFLLRQWQDSVVAIWTPSTRASGFLFDERGLIATNQRVVGTASFVEVQLTAAIKVAASVLVADAARDAAILWIDPAVIASMPLVPLGCPTAETLRVVNGQQIFAIGSPFRQQQKELASGRVIDVDARGLESDLVLAHGSVGGPVFNADGGVVGVTSVSADRDGRRRGDVRTVAAADVCRAMAAAEQRMANATSPSGAHLPVEPSMPFPVDQLKEAAERRAGNLNPYQVSASDFDVAFITPVLAYGARLQMERAIRRAAGTGTPTRIPEPVLVRPLTNFLNWSEYIDDVPPVLLVRITPKMAESFWTTVARGAARTQGVSIPAIKRVKSGFSRLRAYCGPNEVAPIHPFTLEHQLPDDSEVDEGLYVFDPGAFGPQCATVKLVLYSQKEPDREDTRVMDARVVEQIWQDFAPYRELSR